MTIQTQNMDMNETIELLAQYEKETNLDPTYYKHIALVLGNQGDNKKEFLEWFKSDNETYTTTEPENNIDNINESKNLFPKMILHPKINTAFYDCPDFDDERSASDNVASKYFIKKVLDRAEYVKFILVISSFLDNKNIKQDDNFTTLIKHITNLIDIKKFPDSIAIIVTGVEILDDVEEQESDEKIIDSIVQCLSEYRKSFEENKILYNNEKQEREVYENAITLIDILTVKNEDKYSRIGIVRNTNVPLLNNTIFREEKLNIEEIIDNNLKFAKNTHNGFHYTFSKESKEHEYIRDLAKQIQKSLNIVFNNIKGEITKYFQNLIEMTRKKIELFSTSKQSIDEVNFKQAQEFYSSFINGEQAISRLNNINQLITWIELSDKIKNNSNTINSETLLQYIYKLNMQASYLEFLKITSPSNRIRNNLRNENSFNDIIANVTESKQNIQNYINTAECKLTNNIPRNFENVTREIRDQLQGQVGMFCYKQAIEELRDVQNILNIIRKLQDPQQLPDFSSKIIDNSIELKIENSRIKTEISDAINQLMHLNYLINIDVGNQRNVFSTIFIELIEKTVQKFANLKTWYQFLRNLQNKLLGKVCNIDLDNYYVTNIGDINTNKSKTIKITFEKIASFFQKLENCEVRKHENIDLSKLEKHQLEEMNKLLNSVISHPPTPYTTDDYCASVKKAEHIKISDIKLGDAKSLYKNSRKTYSLTILATNTITIDKDIVAVGKEMQLTIIAPKWVIKGERKIVLDGAPAPELVSTNSNNMGQDGRPGLPGGPAGNFFGIGLEFINGDSLTITANGGNGGIGQDGENGVPGRNGKAAMLPLGKMILNKALKQEFSDAIKKYGYRQINLLQKLVYGTKGENGGKGGDGGKGGKGGYEGSISIFDLGEPSGIMTSTKRGTTGKGGKGGNGGIGGQNGDLTKIWHIQGVWAIFEEYLRSDQKGVDGIDGRDDFNVRGIEEPRKPSPLPNIKLIINKYKNDLNLLLNNRKNHLKNNLQAKFYNELPDLSTDNNFQNFTNIKFRNFEINLHKNQVITSDRNKRSVRQQQYPNYDPAFSTTDRVEYSTLNRISYREYNTNVNSPSNPTSLLNFFINTLFALAVINNGKNKTFKSHSFESPEEKRNAIIDHLDSRISPILQLDEYVLSENNDDNNDSGTSLYIYGRNLMRNILTKWRSLIANIGGTKGEEKNNAT